ncbi:MAG TPA: acyl-CoA dehydrogenase family protein [Burkholderiaceae bacterium]
MIEEFELQAIPAEDEALRPRVRAFLDQHWRDVPAQVRAHSWSGFDPGFSRALGAAGFVGLTLPRAYGGAGRSAFARFVVVEELLARGAPLAAHWIADRQSGPMIARYGTEQQRRELLPGICRGELYFCIGMSEPDSGSDLASIRTRATRVDGGWRLSGRKIWTTNAHRAHRMIALVRSAPQRESRHAGLSQFVVDLALPGVSVRPIADLTGAEHFNEVSFDDVRLGEDALIGVEGEGWAQVNAELALERSGPERVLSSIAVFDELIAWLRGAARCDRHALAQIGAIHAEHIALRAMSVAVTAMVARGGNPLTAAAIVKDLGTRVEQRIAEVASRLVFADPFDPPPAQLLEALAYTTQMAPTFSLRGGTREILRSMIARAMGLR